MARPGIRAVPELHIPLTGHQLIRHPPKSALTSRHPGRHPVFDPGTVEDEAFDLVLPGGAEGERLLSARNPGLLALRNKAESARAKTATGSGRKRKRDPEIVSPGFVSTLSKRRPPRESSRKAPNAIPGETNAETWSIAFREDPLAYFSKRKDGRGHRFIYLNNHGDRTNDQFFNPYELVKVPFAEVNPKYFIMSANGVTHVLADGNTEHIPLDRWANESSMFTTLRHLKMFAHFAFWKPFRIWKNVVMRQRFHDLQSAVVAHPFFTHPSFFSTQLVIRDIFVDTDNTMRCEDMIQRYLLSFLPQRKFDLGEYRQEIAENTERLNQLYAQYVAKIQNEVLELDGHIRDPQVLQVKDSDFPEFKRRNPNLAQLMVVEKKKADKRVELTKKVNRETIALGYFIRDIDYMMLEGLAQAVQDALQQALSNVSQQMSSVFQVEVSFSEDGEVVLTPSLADLLGAIRGSLQDSLATTNALPRLLSCLPLRPHIQESHPNFKKLFEEGPKLKEMLKEMTSSSRSRKELQTFLPSRIRKQLSPPKSSPSSSPSTRSVGPGMSSNTSRPGMD
jgi:hypothetical protein